jgi:hypothetical protein
MGAIFLLGMVVVPALLVGLTAWASTVLSGSGRSLIDEATRYGYALIPVGFGMWIAHYLFHFLVGALTIVPLTQEYLAFLGLPLGASPQWALGPLVPDSWLLPIELVFLELGFLVSAVVAFRIALRDLPSRSKAVRGALPWGLLAFLLSLAGAWLLLQPMEMRGTLMGG